LRIAKPNLNWEEKRKVAARTSKSRMNCSGLLNTRQYMRAVPVPLSRRPDTGGMFALSPGISFRFLDGRERADFFVPELVGVRSYTNR
jgi:hypothetical protein